MTIRVGLDHITTYDFDRPVTLGPHVVRLRPAPHTLTPISAYSLRVEPEEHFLNWQQDPFGNFQARLVFPEKTERLQIAVNLVAELSAINPFDFFLEDEAEHAPFDYRPELRADLAPYLVSKQAGPLLDEFLLGLDTTRARTIDYLAGINRRLADEIEYTTRMEPGVQAPEETLRLARGSCRDSSWLLVQVLRRLGFAARFVSGYLIQLVADQAPLEGPSGPTEDFTDLHAWVETFLPGAGWVGLDPTSGLFTAEGHIPLAATPDPSVAAPISGMVTKSEVEFSFSNTIERIAEDPRVTKPYSDGQWASVGLAARQVDDRLKRGDVRLTMGGEPTFVAVDDMESPEWTIAADGPAKRAAGDRLMTRLRARFGPDGVVHHGQGKWYPGEPLPRWQQALIWRVDGDPVWSDPSLLADPGEPGSTVGAVAERFIKGLASNLGLEPDLAMAAHEDPLHRLWEEAQLPVGPPPEMDIDPYDPALGDQLGRLRLLEALEAEPGDPAGWVLPLQRSLPGSDSPKSRWISGVWQTRRSGLFLIPGDSPVGYRLPVQGLAWSDPPPQFEPSPFAQVRPFPPGGPAGPGHRPGAGHEAVSPSSAPGDQDDLGDLGAAETGSSDGSVAPRTALCTEVRNGHLHVFLPPVEDPSDALELVSAIEATAGELSQPVVIEGYPLPTDSRLRQLVVAPDPGVLEVNVPPAADWAELTSIVDGVYEDARAVKLGTEKFDLDGTHTGTGGGNHVTIGGATPADSPLLRRPSLLRSLITYWQHHPSLSYVFSGRFIGPSSQAPRVDEGLNDRIFELETAFAELERQGDDGPPWVVDRLLRHLLVDQTGNTHRSEFCVDKLFSPEGERGRLGLLELRAFEMPPHAQMALVQALLVRAIVARCWEDPYHRELVRWGSALHDRFLLPWFLERDLHQVTDDLAGHDLPIDRDWFDPFLEFRFPRFGNASVAGVGLELRGAIEPWHVLGEEATSAGMARYVDSSVERLQVVVSDHVDERLAITCNGVELPLAETDVNGTWVAGVRFKAWQPPSGLHPTIGIDSPLTFDVVDRHSGRSLGGCRYHVVHPGGLSFQDFPVNAAVAESRRRTRFEQIGHTPGSGLDTRFDLRPSPGVGRPVQHREFPHTLDLRRSARL